MATASPTGDLQKELICAICLVYFDDPVILKCGHNFCRFCILMHWEENGGEDIGYQCPECRMVCKLTTVLLLLANQLAKPSLVACHFLLSSQTEASIQICSSVVYNITYCYGVMFLLAYYISRFPALGQCQYTSVSLDNKEGCS